MPGDDQPECNSQIQLTSLWSRGLHPGQ
jgi:polyphosphate kinase